MVSPLAQKLSGTYSLTQLKTFHDPTPGYPNYQSLERFCRLLQQEKAVRLVLEGRTKNSFLDPKDFEGTFTFGNGIVYQVFGLLFDDPLEVHGEFQDSESRIPYVAVPEGNGLIVRIEVTSPAEDEDITLQECIFTQSSQARLPAIGSQTGNRPRQPQPPPDYTQCGHCYGSGNVSCSSCGGYGYHTSSYSRTDWEGNVEYVDEQIPCGCSGGQIICPTCGGSGKASD